MNFPAVHAFGIDALYEDFEEQLEDSSDELFEGTVDEIMALVDKRLAECGWMLPTDGSKPCPVELRVKEGYMPYACRGEVGHLGETHGTFLDNGAQLTWRVTV